MKAEQVKTKQASKIQANLMPILSANQKVLIQNTLTIKTVATVNILPKNLQMLSVLYNVYK
jgi:hypothetical protein